MPTSNIDELSLVESEGFDDAASQDESAQNRRPPGRTPARFNVCTSPSDDVLDKISYFAMGFVLSGLVFAAIGFLYPRDLARDPDAPARDNESVDLEYMKLTNALNAIIITGMVMIGIGGLILSALFTNTVVCQECRRDAHFTQRTSSPTVTSQDLKTPERGHNYGTVTSPPAESPH